MIDEDRTLQLYGYTSDELAPKSSKTVVRVCEGCGGYDEVRKSWANAMCRSCSQNGNTKWLGKTHTVETLGKMSESAVNRTRKTGWKLTDDTRKNMSAAQQGIAPEEWEGWASDGGYCHKFNEECREHNREKYGRMCFLCGKDEIKNGRKLSVHHVDMNKDQGCDDVVWKLVPLCQRCHNSVHNPTWRARIEYLSRRI